MAIKTVSQRKLNSIVAGHLKALESIKPLSPKEKASRVTAYLNNVSLGNGKYRINGTTYQVEGTTREARKAGYKEIEAMFPDLKRVKKGKNIVYVNQQTGEVLSRRQALNLYTQATSGEKYQTRYSRRRAQKVNLWTFPFSGFTTIEIKRSRKKENRLMGEFWNVVKQVQNENSSTALDEFCKKNKGKAIVEDQVTQLKINLCDVTFDDILNAQGNGVLPVGSEKPYVMNV